MWPRWLGRYRESAQRWQRDPDPSAYRNQRRHITAHRDTCSYNRSGNAHTATWHDTCPNAGTNHGPNTHCRPDHRPNAQPDSGANTKPYASIYRQPDTNAQSWL